MELPEVCHYLGNKEAVRAGLAQRVEISEDDAKACLIALIYGARFTLWAKAEIPNLIGPARARKLFADRHTGRCGTTSSEYGRRSCARPSENQSYSLRARAPRYASRRPELETSVFLIPGKNVKNGEERLVVLNRVAGSVIESQRGKYPDFVFVQEFRNKEPQPVRGMNNTGWKNARERAAEKWSEAHREPPLEGFRRVRVHDLKHTFGRRLRAAGVCFEDRQDLLGHKSGRITTHYSQAELSKLIEAAEKACDASPAKAPQQPGFGERRGR